MNLKWAKVNSFKGNFTNPALTFYRPCPVCGSIDSRVILEFNDFQFFTDSSAQPKRVQLRQNQCLHCFALYLNPCYSEFGFQVLFREAGQSYVSDGSNRHKEQIEWMEQRNLLSKKMSVMDIGCFDGRFLAQMPDSISKIGVDIDATAIQCGRQKFASADIDFICSDFETFHYNKPPHIITMFHVLEHLPRPLSVLLNLRKTSNASTKLIVEVPILENSATNDINGFFSVQHMTHFSRSSLKNCFNLSGWHIVDWDEQAGYNGCRVVAVPSDGKCTIEVDPTNTLSVHKYMTNWYNKLAEVERKLNACEKSRQYIIWGGGLHTEFLYQTTSFFHSNPSQQYIIVDSDVMKHEKSWRGIHIMKPDQLVGLNWMNKKLLISSYGSQNGIEHAAKQLGVPSGCIVKLYDQVRVY